jgi:transglutaminase-like putative cysteine protease
MRRRGAKPLSFLICLCILIPIPIHLQADTLVVDGRLDSTMEMRQQVTFLVDRPVSEFHVRLALPADFSTKSVVQKISGLVLNIEPQPLQMEEEVDRFGNVFRSATWKSLHKNVSITMQYRAEVHSELTALESGALFPPKPKGIPEDVAVYVEPTRLVQSKSPEIVSLSIKLTEGAKTEHDAVKGIINYVTDSVRYTHNPSGSDALHTLKNKSGNCTNIAHLAIALLRAAGIPARFVGGTTLKEQWKIPIPQGNVVQSVGQGNHAWIEVYFPDLGWLPYDPQQSKQFTSSRHIKRAHGPDLDSMNDSWWGSPYVPPYSEAIEGKFLDDAVSVRLKYAEKAPKPYVVSNDLRERHILAPPEKPGPVPQIAAPQVIPVPPATLSEKVPPPQIAAPPPEIKPPATPRFAEVIEFGNKEFPALISLYQVVGNKGVKVMDTETAEYVTSRYIYAQALTVDEEVKMESVSLAMRKFGGDGAIYIDLVSDDKGKPGYSGLRSDPIFIENIRRRQGYYWVDFTFPEQGDLTLRRGKYWIVLRYSGEVIMNWFYTPGKPYGGPFDTRTTSRGHGWDDILSYDFVFKVRGRR